MPYKNVAIFLVAILFLILSPAILANNHNQLNQINHKIANIKALLSAEQNKRSQYQSELKKNEIASGNILEKLKATQQDLKKQQALLTRLSHQSSVYESKLTSQQAWLAQQIRMAYIVGQQPYLKLILNQSDAEKMSRILTYYRYISRDQVEAIQQLQTTIEQIQNNQQQIQSETSILKQLENNQQKEHDKLKHAQELRKTLIQKINSQINTKSQRLAELLANKRLLERTISQLEEKKSTYEAMHVDFGRLKGKLPWPTKGKVLPYFGNQIYQSQIRWAAILIRAPEDQPVHAIASGKVVFAKWLPGYGLLLIISHGHGYMTLYGRNHYLYKKPGDLVQKGDLIATVGNSGGYEKPALYFAIRHNAIPLNPVNWCRSG